MFDCSVVTKMADNKVEAALPAHEKAAKAKLGVCHMTGTQLTTIEGGFKLTSYWQAGEAPIEKLRADHAAAQAEAAATNEAKAAQDAAELKARMEDETSAKLADDAAREADAPEAE